ncbi:hypothetical protein Vretimale_17082 [Volvox reticuliferus]|uniref:Uncharacterized protein n=1 Tax=Volvox reticuliferus TaxID=1737510 RepID=A0A8J4CXK5_9CHLO|nr:hypothetical protein Vretifemale_18676 [Volvox reticuliferus]GIM14052.1 hypothetical protein Vretimale_17082 [Volvox reticuliferus]
MHSDELLGLLWAAQYAAKICIRCNRFLGRLVGASSSSPNHIWVQCRCSGCQTREPVGFADGGNILNLTEFAQHACAQSPSLRLFTVVQPGAPNDPIPLLDWLRSANEHMGGDALIRRQLCIFWSGFGDKTDMPNTWRSATIRRIDKATGACEIKYHDDRRKRSQAFLYLPLTIVHFARCPPAPGAVPRNVADGQMPLPPLLPSQLPLPPPQPHEQQPQLQQSATSIMTSLSLSVSGTATSVPSPPVQPPAATSSPFCRSSSTPSAPAATVAILSRMATAATATAAETTMRLAADGHQLSPPTARMPQLATRSSHPSSYPTGSLFTQASEQSQLPKSRSGSSGAFQQNMFPSTPAAPETPTKRPWVPSAPKASAVLTPGHLGGPYGVDAAILTEFSPPPLKLLRTCGDDDLRNPEAPARSAGKPADYYYAKCQVTSRALNGSSAVSTSAVRPMHAAVESTSSGSSNVQGAVGAGAAAATATITGPPTAGPCHRQPPSSSLPYSWSAHEPSSAGATAPGWGSAACGNGSGNGGVSGSSNSIGNSNSSSRSLVADTAADSADGGERGWDIRCGGAPASCLVRQALPGDCSSYSYSRSRSSSRHTSSNGGSCAQFPYPESWAAVLPLQPPTSAAAITEAATAMAVAGGSTTAAIAPLMPLSSTTPAAIQSTMTSRTAGSAAADPDAALDAFLAASFDFFADSDQPEYPGGARWLSEFCGGSDPATSAPGPNPQPAANSAMPGLPCATSVVASPCGGLVSPAVRGTFLGNSISGTAGGGSSSAAPSHVLKGVPNGPFHVNGLGSNHFDQSMLWFDSNPEAAKGG